MTADRYAFVLRIAPSGVDRVEEALRDNHAIIGWANAPQLLDRGLEWEAFREVVRKRYYRNDDNQRRAGAAGGHLWRFLRDMNPGALLTDA